MTRNDNRRIGRRPVLKGAGAALAGAAGLASPVAANGGNGNGGGDGGGKQPLEETPSLTAALVFEGAGVTFGYPANPTLRTFDPGKLFDTTRAEITPRGQVIHYQLQFGADSKPYVLPHGSDGQYTSKGSVINFEGPAPDLGLPAGKYRATVRDVVQLYGKGGYFDWSVTRTDFYVRPGMEYFGSSLIIVWDEDGQTNDDEDTYRNDPADVGNNPVYSPGVLGQATYDAIDSSAKRLIAAGPSNPGGQ